LILTSTDLLVMLLYFAAVLAIGYALKSRIKTSRDFLEAGRSLPSWVCGLAFLGAGLGAPVVIGMGAMGARYGLQAAHFLGIGAIPAMIFAGLVLMPYYYSSKARSVPEFLGLRFDQKTRTLNACMFLAMTVFTAGVSLCLMARVMQALHVFDGLFRAFGLPPEKIFTFCMVLCAVVVLGYVELGGLGGAVWNHALQFVLLVAGLPPVAVLGLRNIGGWSGLGASLPNAFMHQWSGVAHSAGTPMGIGLAAVGLGILLGASYWCTDFRVIQIALAAKSVESARRVPLIAAIPMVFLPFLLVVPGMVAVGLPTPHTNTVSRVENGVIYHNTTVVRPEVEAGRGLVPAKIDRATGKPMLTAAGQPVLNYEMATPNLLPRFLPSGLLALGLAALLASLMSGMAANVTAFTTVFTYDLYQTHVRKEAIDRHYLAVGRWAALGAALLAVAVAFAAASSSILTALILAVSLVNVPLLATLLLGVFWKRTTGHGAFAGLIAGSCAGLLHHGLTLPAHAHPGMHGGWIAVLHSYPGAMPQSFWTAIFAFGASLIVTVAVSYCSKPRTELMGMVLARKKLVWWKRPEALAIAILLAAVAVSLFFA
jgi:SSS family solute:Na+ symporter